MQKKIPRRILPKILDKILGKIAGKIAAAFFCIIFSCTQVKLDPFILSDLPNIQILERQDHNFCSSLKVDFDKSDNLKSGLYWRCRLSLAKYRLYTDNSIPKNAEHNIQISDLITKISLKLADTPESVMIRENKKMDSRQHQQCLRMGFAIDDTEDQTKIDDYFACRVALIEDQQLIPPFGNEDYMQYPNRSYNIGFVVNQRIDREIERYEAAKEKYPACVQFNLNNINFKNCTMAQDQSRQCFSQIEKKRFKKEVEEKTICQKQSYIEFPDEFLKDENQAKKDIERMKTNSDFYNQYNFAAIGIDDKQFGINSGSGNKNQKKLPEQKERARKINSKAGLYNKFELTKLRQRYIFLCQKEADSKIRQYVTQLEKSCQDLSEFKIIGE
jgi:hypothetical protein